jgi:hypothetical protein
MQGGAATQLEHHAEHIAFSGREYRGYDYARTPRRSHVVQVLNQFHHVPTDAAASAIEDLNLRTS